MAQIFTFLSHAIEGAPAWALLASAAWGILSILLSPCHLASIPLIVGFIGNQGQSSTQKAFFISSMFSVGILITIAAIGILTASAGRMMGDVGPYGNYFVAAIFFAVGLHLTGFLPLHWPGASQVGIKKKGAFAAFLLGLIFGIALGPCTFAYMAPVLAVTFRLGSSHLFYASTLLLAYGIGHCAVIVVAGTSTELVQHFLNWNEKSRSLSILKISCGILVICAGIYLLLTAT